MKPRSRGVTILGVAGMFVGISLVCGAVAMGCGDVREGTLYGAMGLVALIGYGVMCALGGAFWVVGRGVLGLRRWARHWSIALLAVSAGIGTLWLAAPMAILCPTPPPAAQWRMFAYGLSFSVLLWGLPHTFFIWFLCRPAIKAQFKGQ